MQTIFDIRDEVDWRKIHTVIAIARSEVVYRRHRQRYIQYTEYRYTHSIHVLCADDDIENRNGVDVAVRWHYFFSSRL